MRLTGSVGMLAALVLLVLTGSRGGLVAVAVAVAVAVVLVLARLLALGAPSPAACWP